MFNVSTGCGITLASVLPLWESQCSFLLFLVSPIGSSSGQDSWLAGWLLESEVTQREPDSGPWKTEVSFIMSWWDRRPYNKRNRKVQITYPRLFWQNHICSSATFFFRADRHAVKGIVANQNKMLRQARHEQTWEQQAHPAAEFSTHRPRCATHYPSPTHPHPSTNTHYTPVPFWCWRWVLVEKSGATWSTGAPWVEMPGWWSSNASF